MSGEKLNAAVKTRVGRSMKRELERIASSRHLDVADIVREALREFVAKPENVSHVEQSQPQEKAA